MILYEDGHTKKSHGSAPERAGYSGDFNHVMAPALNMEIQAADQWAMGPVAQCHRVLTTNGNQRCPHPVRPTRMPSCSSRR